MAEGENTKIEHDRAGNCVLEHTLVHRAEVYVLKAELLLTVNFEVLAQELLGELLQGIDVDAPVGQAV